jgi:hydroxyethylthiazole kinase
MEAYPFLKKVRDEVPLVHHITNWVTISDCANIVKAFGASPVMAHAREEAQDMAALAKSLVLNIGTLTSELIGAMIAAGRKANGAGIPVVLDVCGAGATAFRDRKVEEILRAVEVGVVKGNVSEIARVAGERAVTKGVDAGFVDKDRVEIARGLARGRKTVAVITGETDVVADAEAVYLVRNGCELMSRVVGTGCMAASAIGAFAAVCANGASSGELAAAAAAALACYGLCGELAARSAPGPGTFKERLFDAAYALDEEVVVSGTRIEKR